MSTKLDDLGGTLWSPGSEKVPAIRYAGTRKSTGKITVRMGTRILTDEYNTRGAFLDTKSTTTVTDL